MQDDRTARYRQAAIAAREKAASAIDPKLWVEIADSWDQLAGHVETLAPGSSSTGGRLRRRTASPGAARTRADHAERATICGVTLGQSRV
jgi:hypothetical protein